MINGRFAYGSEEYYKYELTRTEAIKKLVLQAIRYELTAILNEGEDEKALINKLCLYSDVINDLIQDVEYKKAQLEEKVNNKNAEEQ